MPSTIVETTNETMAVWMSFKKATDIQVQKKNDRLVYYCEFAKPEQASEAQTSWNTFDTIEPHLLTKHHRRIIQARLAFKRNENKNGKETAKNGKA